MVGDLNRSTQQPRSGRGGEAHQCLAERDALSEKFLAVFCPSVSICVVSSTLFLPASRGPWPLGQQSLGTGNINCEGRHKKTRTDAKGDGDNPKTDGRINSCALAPRRARSFRFLPMNACNLRCCIHRLRSPSIRVQAVDNDVPLGSLVVVGRFLTQRDARLYPMISLRAEHGLRMTPHSRP
jgi:hypothetical protein